MKEQHASDTTTILVTRIVGDITRIDNPYNPGPGPSLKGPWAMGPWVRVPWVLTTHGTIDNPYNPWAMGH
jgi:hypothetical protein